MERSGLLQVHGSAQDAVTCEWAWAGTSTFHETSTRPAHENGLWEIGPVQLDLDVDFRISVNGMQHIRNMKTIPDIRRAISIHQVDRPIIKTRREHRPEKFTVREIVTCNYH